MNKMWRVLISLSLIVFGTLFAEGYKDPLYLCWLISLGLLLILIQHLLDRSLKQGEELAKANYKISSLAMAKESNTNVLQISPFPNDLIIENKEGKIDLFVTSAIPLSKPPQIKLLTKVEWEIKVSHQRQHFEKYGNSFEYVLKSPFVENKDNKFFRYSFNVKINEPGEHDLEIQVNNGELESAFKSSITVKRSNL